MEQKRKDFLAKHAAVDDLLDALVLCISATERFSTINSLPAITPFDEKGLPMQICYPMLNRDLE